MTAAEEELADLGEEAEVELEAFEDPLTLRAAEIKAGARRVSDKADWPRNLNQTNKDVWCAHE